MSKDIKVKMSFAFNILSVGLAFILCVHEIDAFPLADDCECEELPYSVEVPAPKTNYVPVYYSAARSSPAPYNPVSSSSTYNVAPQTGPVYGQAVPVYSQLSQSERDYSSFYQPVSAYSPPTSSSVYSQPAPAYSLPATTLRYSSPAQAPAPAYNPPALIYNSSPPAYTPPAPVYGPLPSTPAYTPPAPVYGPLPSTPAYTPPAPVYGPLPSTPAYTPPAPVYGPLPSTPAYSSPPPSSPYPAPIVVYGTVAPKNPS